MQRECGWCGQPFFSRWYKRWCSPTCEYTGRAKRHHPERITLCACGQMVIGTYGRNCPACRRKIKVAVNTRNKRRRKAAKLGVPSDRYTLQEIAMRDGLRCGICGKRVSLNHKHPDDRAATIDHIVPLSKGGDDTRSNVQLAHHRCNYTKRDGGSQQLLLVG